MAKQPLEGLESLAIRQAKSSSTRSDPGCVHGGLGLRKPGDLARELKPFRTGENFGNEPDIAGIILDKKTLTGWGLFGELGATTLVELSAHPGNARFRQENGIYHAMLERVGSGLAIDAMLCDPSGVGPRVLGCPGVSPAGAGSTPGCEIFEPAGSVSRSTPKAEIRSD